MDNLQKSLTILNLTGELSKELSEYFSTRNIEIHSPESNEDQDWTHIITKDLHEFDHLNTVYDLIKKDRFIISLSKVSDLKNFTINNGNLILDDCWFQTDLGSFIMDKYLQGYGGINLGDNYPTFLENGSFNVANPFNTGEYLDRMVQKAFEQGTDALSVKTYFDHLVMYIAGLKNKGKAGLPLEVTYGSFNDVFGVQIHFFAQNLGLIDFTASLNSSVSKRAEEYFLNIAVHASDFFDFSYLPEVNKVIITAMWTKDERVKFENRGLMFTSVKGGTPLVQYATTEASSSLIVSGTPIEDFSEKITVSGGESEEESSQLVKGSEELDDLVQTIKGKLEEDKSVFKIGGNKLDVDKTAFRIAATVKDSAQDKNMSVKSLGAGLQNNIKNGMFDFAKKLNKNIEDLDASELALFQTENIPELLKAELANKSALKVRSLGSQAADQSSSELLKEMQAKLLTATSDNEKLKTQLRTVLSEVRILKESRNKMAEIQAKAQAATSEINLQADDETVDNENDDLINKINQKLDDKDAQKLSQLLDSVKQEELKVRKLQLESSQKDSLFSQHLEKSEREIKSRDLILLKTKETFTKLIEKKDNQLADLKSKVEQLSKALVANPASNQNQVIKDLEKQNQNLNKQVEMYKVKITSMATNLQPSKSEDFLKEEARKLQMLNQQMKNQLDQAKRELEKQQAKASSDNAQIILLKQEKVKYEQILKKAAQDAKEASAKTPTTQNDQELKRLQAQNQVLETQVKDSAQKISVLETRLVEALKPQKTSNSGDEGSSVKVNQLENSVKKLTQDLIASKNAIAESKKETNKLRQEKTALQNTLDKMKKEADRAKSAAPKKPGGKAA